MVGAPSSLSRVALVAAVGSADLWCWYPTVDAVKLASECLASIAREMRLVPIRRSRGLPISMLLVGTLTIPFVAAAGASSPPQTLTGRHGWLNGVVSLSRYNVWTVGQLPSVAGPLAFHHRRAGWARVSAPGGSGDYLASVDGVSAPNVWAVGSAGGRTMIIHWNGHRWASIRHPSPRPSAGSVLNGVSALTRSDAWAVGSYYTGGGESTRTLIEHWNGHHWARIPSPNPPGAGFDGLNAVTALSRSNVWAVGSTGLGATILHWNGSRWVHVPSPDGGGSGELYSVSAVSRSNIWAFGTTGSKALIMHWNGARWSRLRPHVPGRFNLLGGVSAAAPSAVWAVGWYYVRRAGGGHATKTLVLRWNGTRWRHVPSPNPGASNSDVLNSVSASSPSRAWAVGYSGADPKSRVVVLRWNGTRWRRS
jgi:hypothetical protein